ncbi:MAG: IPT/TIG domain-containing protein, partial [Bryobacterales bacterium]|nr:IPT/TIG domain-containing protein [Bryobacterales bacterium]
MVASAAQRLWFLLQPLAFRASTVTRAAVASLLLALITASLAMAQISVSPIGKQVPFNAGTSSFAVTVPSDTIWNVEVIRGIDLVGVDSPDISWVSITSNTTQTGSGTIAFSYTANPELFPRTARFFIRVQGNSEILAEHRFVQEPVDTTIILNPTSIAIDGFGGDRTISVTLGPQSPWTATTAASWIQILTGPSTGPGNLLIRIAPNFTGQNRSGTVNVGSASVSVTQTFSEATFTLGANSASFPFNGGNGTVTVTAVPAGAPWQATSNNPFIVITNGGSYTGTGTVTYSVATNPNETARTGTITIAGQTFTVNQAANPGEPEGELSSSVNNLSFLSNPLGTSTLERTASISSTGDSFAFTVQVNNAPWLSVTPMAGVTPAVLTFVANPSGLAPGVYSGTVVISATGSPSVTIGVSLDVRNTNFTRLPLNASPRSLYFSRISGGAVPPPQRIRLGNPEEIVQASLQVTANNWLAASINRDDNGPGIQVVIRNVNLLPGVYDGKIEVRAQEGDFLDMEIPVRYVVQLAPAGAPVIFSGGVVNAASFRAGGAPNTWISVFGSGLANSTMQWNPSTIQGAQLPTSLDGTEVFVDGVRAPISFISPAQVNALVPGITKRGWVEVQVRVNSQPSLLGYLFLRDADPAFFVYTPENGKFPAAQHPDGMAVGPTGLFPGGPPSRPATAVSDVVLYGTGFGPTVQNLDPALFFRGAAELLDLGKLSTKLGVSPANITFA